MCCFLLKYFIHNTSLSCENVALSVIGEKYAHISHSLQAKTVLNKLHWCILIWMDKRGHIFASQDVKWWIEVVWITCGLLLFFYQLFGLSFWRHPFTAKVSLVSKWCIAKFIRCRNKLIWILALGKKKQQYLMFRWTIPLRLIIM